MINKKRLLDTFINLVKIDSPTKEEKEISVYICNLLEKRGIKCFRDKLNNVLVKIPGRGAPLLLSAHLDTVEPGRGVRPVIKNGKITPDGRTVLGADDKVAVAAIIEAISKMHEAKLDSRPLDVIFTVSEETGSYGVLGLDYSKISANEGYIFDTSKGIGTIVTASPFYDRFDAEIIGKSSHASLPENGINAVSILRDALNLIKVGRVSRNTLVNIGVLQGGDARNTIPGLIRLKGEVRSFSRKEQNQNVEKIETIFRNVSKKHGSKLKFNHIRENSGYNYKNNDKMIVDIIRVMRKMRINPVLLKVYGCSDANVFLEKGIRVLNLGDGAKNAHTVREEIKISDLNKLSELILSLSRN